MAPRIGLAAIIDIYAARIRSIANCANEHIRFARQSLDGWKNQTPESIRQHLVGFTDTTVVVDNRFHEDITNHLLTPPDQILAEALLGAGFSTFDAFLHKFLGLLYREERPMLGRLEEKEIRIAEILNCQTIEEAQDVFIERNVSKLLRESYTTVFTTLAKWHRLETLQEFPSWRVFVEASQRRHLFTHCDGIVSSQYMDVCSAAKCSLPEGIGPGTQLSVDSDYLRDTLDMLYEVIVMLGVTLWRTASPRFVDPAERFLTDEIFTLLDRERWSAAITLSKFALDLPKKHSDLQTKICRINYAQALKWSGDSEAAINVLDAIDWSGSAADLRLGVEVVRENYDNAAKLMRQIGQSGELILKTSYKFWPIFREFRKTEQFLSAFQEIFGEPFADEKPGPTIDTAALGNEA